MGDDEKMDQQQIGPTLVTQAEFARIKGVTHGAIQDAIKRGRLSSASFQLSPNGSKRLMILDVANREWASRKRIPRKEQLANEQAIRDKTQGELDGHVSARSKKDEYDAKLKQLDYEQRAGILVKIEDVRVEAFSLARMVRDNVLNIPDRISHELAAELDPHKIHIMLTRALNEALDQLAGIDRPDEPEGETPAAAEEEQE